MYPVRSYANLDDRVSHEGESAYRVGREISKARAFSNFCRWNGKKKKKKIRHVYARIRIYKFPKENLQWDLFFFLNFTSNDDQIRKTFLFLRSRSKGRNLTSVLTRSLFESSKLVFDLFSFVVCACSRFDRLDRRRFIISSIDGGEKDGGKSTRGARTRVN